MHKTFIILFFIILFLGRNAYSQNTKDTITIERWIGVSYKLNKKVLNATARLDLMESYPDAYAEMKIARTNLWAGNLMSFAGGFMIGFPLGVQLRGGSPDWTLAAVGVALVVFSVPFNIAYQKRSLHAVRMYNEHIKKGDNKTVHCKIGILKNGLGMSFVF